MKASMFANEKLSIIGSGTMGHSIAFSAALAGLELKVWGNSEADLEQGHTGLIEKIQVLTRHGVISEEEGRTIESRIRFTTSLAESIDGASFIIEAIPENVTLKQECFANLDALCAQNVILASNTSQHLNS